MKIFFNSLSSVIAEFPTSNFILVRSYISKKQTELHVFILSILQFIWRDLAIALEATFGEGVLQKCRSRRLELLCKKMFFKISPNSQARELKAAGLFKNSLWHICFPVNFTKILGTPF